MDPLEVLSGHIDLAMKHVLEASMTDPKVRFVYSFEYMCCDR